MAGAEHAQIQIQQVQKIPDNSNKDNLKEELAELKQLFSKISEKDKELEKIVKDVDQRTNKAAMDINNMKTD